MRGAVFLERPWVHATVFYFLFFPLVLLIGGANKTKVKASKIISEILARIYKK